MVHTYQLHTVTDILAFLDLVYDSRFLMIYKSLNSVFASIWHCHFLAGL